MKDSSGNTVKLGDRVRLWEETFGSIVCDFDEGLFSERFPKEDWGYLKIGVLIEMDSGELHHFGDGMGEDLEVISASNGDGRSN